MAKTAKEQPFNAITYMELAVEEMNKSKNEARLDGMKAKNKKQKHDSSCWNFE